MDGRGHVRSDPAGRPTDAFYGERSGVVLGPFGHGWNIGHSIEAVTPEEMQRYDQTV